MNRYLLCTDLDRTLIPNGTPPESPEAKAIFDALANRDEVTLVYVSGRHRAMIEQAIADYGLPQPDFAIADVGTSIYRASGQEWLQQKEWDMQIAPDWQGLTHADVYRLLCIYPALRLQEESKQNRRKLSFYVSPDADTQRLGADMDIELRNNGIKANLIWSMDTATGHGFLDVLPASANKLHAIRFLMRLHNFDCANTLFAGDSGNDLDVLSSDIPAVLVANAADEIKERAAAAHDDNLYIAKGGYLGMNGNYSAGILEGVAHYWPEADGWMRELSERKGR